MLLVIIFVLGAGWSFFIAARPEVGFFLEEGWKFRDAEPSDLYLGVTRFGAAVTGIALLVFAAIFAFSGPEDRRTPPTGDPSEASSEDVARILEQQERERLQSQKECDRLKPTFEKAAKWTPEHKLANPDDVRALAAAEDAELEIKKREDNKESVTVGRDEATPTGPRFRIHLSEFSAICIVT